MSYYWSLVLEGGAEDVLLLMVFCTFTSCKHQSSIFCFSGNHMLHSVILKKWNFHPTKMGNSKVHKTCPVIVCPFLNGGHFTVMSCFRVGRMTLRWCHAAVLSVTSRINEGNLANYYHFTASQLLRWRTVKIWRLNNRTDDRLLASVRHKLMLAFKHFLTNTVWTSAHILDIYLSDTGCNQTVMLAMKRRNANVS